jgi:galactokinase
MANAPLISQRFRAHFGIEPKAIASAPGRVNLIGEHTDYNEGFVLPLAIDHRVMMAASRRDDRALVVRSEEYAEDRAFDLATAPRVISRGWDGYVLGVVRALSELGDVPGMNVYIGSGLPVGAGLASSSALEIGLMRAICAIAAISWESERMIPLAQRVEVDFLGVRSGIMDQTAISLGRKGHAMLFDCRSLDIKHVPIPEDIAIVVMDTGMRRTLSASEYNERRESCEAAVATIRRTHPSVRALRDVTRAILKSSEHALSATERRRATHVVRENGRPAAMAAALAAGDYGRAGTLLNESHASLRDLYEVSSQHLDIICETARQHPACFGARMTGAGFGGCAIALVKGDARADFVRVTQPQYEARTYQKSAFYPVTADDGVALLQ